MDKAYFDQKRLEIKEFQKKMKDDGKQFFKEQAKEIFDKNPIIHSFSWAQYTPYFNDGDTCEFSAATGYPGVRFIGDEFDPEDGFDWDEAEQYIDDKDESEKAAVSRDIIKFLSAFDDDDFRLLFGDHVRVIVSPKSVKVEEYDHE